MDVKSTVLACHLRARPRPRSPAQRCGRPKIVAGPRSPWVREIAPLAGRVRSPGLTRPKQGQDVSKQMARGLAWGPQLCRPAIRYTFATCEVAARCGMGKVGDRAKMPSRLSKSKGGDEGGCKAKERWLLDSVLRCVCRWGARVHAAASPSRATWEIKIGAWKGSAPEVVADSHPATLKPKMRRGRRGGRTPSPHKPSFLVGARKTWAERKISQCANCLAQIMVCANRSGSPRDAARSWADLASRPQLSCDGWLDECGTGKSLGNAVSLNRRSVEVT